MTIVDEVKDFIRNYTKALKTLVEENRQKIESVSIIPWFPTEFPVKATAHLGKSGISLDFDKGDHFEISIKRGERPQKRGKWSQFILYGRFAKIKDRAFEKAESDIQRLLSLPGMIEEQEQEMQRFYDALWTEEVRHIAEHYVEFLGKSGEVVDKTKETRTSELYDIVTVIQNHLSNFEYMLPAGCNALNLLHFMINSDMETSLFLALHGKYYSAMAILRKILETSVRCIYLDSLDDEAEAKRVLDGWTAGGSFPRGRGFKRIMNEMIDSQIDQKLTDLLRRYRVFENGLFKQSTVSLYKELCQFVHLRPSVRWEDDLVVLFSEFNLDKWQKYYSTFMRVVKIIEILLIHKFPEISSMRALGDTGQIYEPLQLSKQELDEIARAHSFN